MPSVWLSARVIVALLLVVAGVVFVVLSFGQGDVISAFAGILGIITGVILYYAAPRRRE
jgi:hypothetical protein